MKCKWKIRGKVVYGVFVRLMPTDNETYNMVGHLALVKPFGSKIPYAIPACRIINVQEELQLCG